MNAPLAVIIPCFNSGRYILQALDSALAQRFDVQVVVCDDGSTDGETVQTLDRIRRMGDSRVLVVGLDRNRGISAARNRAVAETRAPYLMFLDADDRVDPEYGRRAVDILSGDSNVRIVSSPLQCFGASDEVRRYGGAPRGVVDLLFENKIPASSVIRREDWQRVGGFDETVRWAEDYDLWVRILRGGGTSVELETPLYFYRQHDGQLTSSMSVEQINERQLAMVERHSDVWAAHVVEIMDRHFDVQGRLRHYQNRYGRLEGIKSKMVDVFSIRR